MSDATIQLLVALAGMLRPGMMRSNRVSATVKETRDAAVRLLDRFGSAEQLE